MTKLDIRDLVIAHGKNTILSDITLADFEPGSVIGVLGPNGVGKSSFLRSLAGLAPYGGSITYDGDENRKLSHNQRARKVAYLPQTLPQATNLVAYEAVISACRAVRHDLTRDHVETLTERVFDRLNIRHIAFQPLSRMSGGQRQMVGLAQIIVREPDIMLLDEPTSALDLRWQLGVLDVVRTLVKDKQGLALIALHDINLAMRHCDSLILFGEGGVLSHGAPRHAMTPEMLSRAYHVSGRLETCSHGSPFVIVDGLNTIEGHR
ncbi:ABC transporter ATP-binding protein [uncultured Thalassospira sp.]|uniref:ABC transporter ATP-binding protein n=1 Tax=uncultured Thalassospira sp. TaxID=404382 RepID=UPI00259A646A|nr:ABC transporter ATP-binding protein [uncultured Thalassospira sp.]